RAQGRGIIGEPDGGHRAGIDDTLNAGLVSRTIEVLGALDGRCDDLFGGVGNRLIHGRQMDHRIATYNRFFKAGGIHHIAIDGFEELPRQATLITAFTHEGLYLMAVVQQSPDHVGANMSVCSSNQNTHENSSFYSWVGRLSVSPRKQPG